jgi:site-specific DNA-cytosine methylase
MVDYDCTVACDPKKHGSAFVGRSYAKPPQHWFPTLQDVLGGGGTCHVHGGRCEVPLQPAGVDLALGGPACQPFTRFRPKKDGKTGKQGPAISHPDAHISLELYPRYLSQFRPRTFCMEQVKGFQDKVDKNDPDSQTFLDKWCDQVAGLGQV